MIQLLKSHPFFHHSRIDSCVPLANQGYCNENYVLVADGVKYVVRRFLREDRDREFEWKVQNLAYAQGITAKPLVFDRENGFMVFEFLEGEHKSKLNRDELKLLVQTLQKLHSVNIEAKPIELVIDCSSIDTYPKEYVLCHNDLNPQNIFFAKDVKCIDWEYAEVNDRYFDLAAVSVEFRFEPLEEAYFLASYFGREGWNQEKLDAYKVIYKALCEKWFNENT